MSNPRQPAHRPTRLNILGVGVHATYPSQAVDILMQAAASGEKGWVCVTGVHGIMESQKDAEVRSSHNRSLLTVPDGMPTVWIGRAKGHSSMRRVYGPDLMDAVLRESVSRKMTHFFFGGIETVAQAPGMTGAEYLKQQMEQRYEGIRIVGTYTPPFRPLNAAEDAELARLVASTKPDFFWVGLSTPKQEIFMSNAISRLDTTIMLGVGAAFDMLAGLKKDAPDVFKATGLQWLYRLCQEPRRLARRYLFIVPAFLCLFVLQAAGLRKQDLPPECIDHRE